MRSRHIALTAVLVWAALSGTSRAQSEDEIAKRFVGAWRLVSAPQRLADGTTRQNPTSVGFIIYTDTHRMCALAMDPNRAKWNVASPFEGTKNPAEALSAIGGADAYCSSVDIHAKEGFVLHHVEGAIKPNLVGVTRKRYFTFEGPNRVALRVDSPELVAPIVESTLIWERIGK